MNYCVNCKNLRMRGVTQNISNYTCKLGNSNEFIVDSVTGIIESLTYTGCRTMRVRLGEVNGNCPRYELKLTLWQKFIFYLFNE